MPIKAGATSQSINLFIQNTDGDPLTGLVHNSAGLTAYYARPKAAAVAITLATLAAVTSAYSSGGFKEIDAANMPGWYRFDIPDAAIASGVDHVTLHLKGASTMNPLPFKIELVAYDPQDVAGLGLSRLDVALSTLATAANLSGVAVNVNVLGDRLGAFAGSGVNTVLGFLRAMFNKTATMPSDLTSGGLTGNNTTDSNEAIRDRGDAAWTGGGGGGGGVEITGDTRVLDVTPDAYTVVALDGDVFKISALGTGVYLVAVPTPSSAPAATEYGVYLGRQETYNETITLTGVDLYVRSAGPACKVALHGTLALLD